MLKLLQTNPQIDLLAKIVQTVMQLRVDVKESVGDNFRNFVNQLKKPCQLGMKDKISPLASFNIKDLHGVRTKLETAKRKSIDSITIKFSFVNKKSQTVEVAEIWRLHNVRYGQPKSPLNQKDFNNISLLFEDVIDCLFKLPMWVDYWSNKDNLKQAKQNTILDFSIQYGQKKFESSFPFDCKMNKQHKMLDMALSLTVMYSSKLNIISPSPVVSKKQNDRTVTLHKLSGQSRRTRRCSVYEYYDEELDITFVSSEGELDLNDNSMSEITFQVQMDQESDEQYEMIIENAEETRFKQFSDKLLRLTKVAEEANNSDY